MSQEKPIGQNPWQNQARTPGPLGINDAASPFSSMAGPTPGPRGINDDSPGCDIGPSQWLMGTDGADGSGGGSGGAGACPEVEIQINKSPTDNLVLRQYPISTMKSVTPCRLHAKSKSASFTVVLTNPDGKLHFTEDKNTLTINVPGGGVDWVNFEITGVKGSDTLDDAIIEAHCGTDTGPLVGTKAVTVVWFDASMDVHPEDGYSINGDDFNAAGKAVTLDATASIRPKGVNCTALQIAGLRVGIIQNSLPFSSGSRKRTAFYGPPEVYWLPSAPIGTKVQVPAQWQLNFEASSASNDSTSGSNPLYNMPAAKDRPLDFDKDLAKPEGCGTGTTESRDNPGIFLGSGAQIWVRVSNGSGKGNAPARESVIDDMGKAIRADSDSAVIGGQGDTLGWVKYEISKATLQQNFMDWAVIINAKTKEFICLRQRGWSLDVDSSAPGKKANPDPGDKDPTALPITGGTLSNDINNNRTNWKTGPVAGKMVPVIKDSSSKTTDDALAMPVGIPPKGIS